MSMRKYKIIAIFNYYYYYILFISLVITIEEKLLQHASQPLLKGRRLYPCCLGSSSHRQPAYGHLFCMQSDTTWSDAHSREGQIPSQALSCLGPMCPNSAVPHCCPCVWLDICCPLGPSPCALHWVLLSWERHSC